MNFKQYDDGKEGRFFVILDNGMEAGWIQYKWLDNGNLLANGTRVYEEFKDQKLGIPLFNRLVEFAEERKTKIYPLFRLLRQLLNGQGTGRTLGDLVNYFFGSSIFRVNPWAGFGMIYLGQGSYTNTGVYAEFRFPQNSYFPIGIFVCFHDVVLRWLNLNKKT